MTRLLMWTERVIMLIQNTGRCIHVWTIINMWLALMYQFAVLVTGGTGQYQQYFVVKVSALKEVNNAIKIVL